MRRENAGFRTAFVSEEGTKLLNRDYFAYVELDDYACYVTADSLDDEKEINSAKIVVECILREFTEHPSMNSFSLKTYVRRAHKELLGNRQGMRLRAGVAMIVTNYVKCRYITVGNSRFALFRNDRIMYESKDQSLTENLVEREEIPRDKAAVHEERNNLYSYLGQNSGRVQIQVSRKRKLANGDVFLLYTRGIWENCDNAELLDAIKDVSTPQESADNVEELILGRQKSEIDNYTLAVTFVDKVYLNPKKRWTVKKVLAIVIPVVIVLLVIGITLFVRYRIRSGRESEMEQHIESAGQYIAYDNYEKAADEYRQSFELAKKLKDKEKQEEMESCRLLAEQILHADQIMEDGDYNKALELYEQALELSGLNGGIGAGHIREQMDKIGQYQELYELLESAEGKEEYGDYAGAIELYKEAKSVASALYDQDVRTEALTKQREAEEALEKLRQEQMAELEEKVQKAIEDEKVAQELADQSLMNDKKNALELESKGNELMNKEDYVSAIPYFETAKSMYENLGMVERAGVLEEQIEACGKLAEEAKRKAEEEAARQAAEEADQKASENKAVEDAQKAAQEAKQAIQDMKDAEKDKALEDAQKAAEEAKKAAQEAEEARKAAEEAKKAAEESVKETEDQDQNDQDKDDSQEEGGTNGIHL
ncbi:MAG: hypothetical protein K2J99_17060 [Lachnospiraceae bacterium]|nr:hypothetical protein [Lachnospiraceae bacterium]